ncbi:MAG: DUF4450 domain-containing protein [Saprospiraceae bacterium]|nr:DUF4450 domain-containing protein [Saprospiraceae bacterium]
MLFRNAFLFFTCLLVVKSLAGQAVPGNPDPEGWWHGIERTLRYTPDGTDFAITNGTRRFNRALYGTNTGFRVEAGDLPQFALYMPGMGGSLKFGLLGPDTGKWLIDAERITARYRSGGMSFEISDSLLGAGRLFLDVLAMSDGEGILVKITFEEVGKEVELFWAFGGATGKRFNRDGDIGADPESSFYLKPEYCGDNLYVLQENNFELQYGSGRVLSEAERYEIQHTPDAQPAGAAFGNKKRLIGLVPPGGLLKIADANQQASPGAFWASEGGITPAVVGKIPAESGEAFYFAFHNPESKSKLRYEELPALFEQSEAVRQALTQRVKLNTPDDFINPVGPALAVAADAIYEHPSYLHGAVAWRMRLNGWRGAYVADPLGWHDRARAHFTAYAQSQLTDPVSGPVIPDTALHFARQLERLGTALFSSGYICRNPNGDFRAHHYDMNLVFIDQLLRHLRWTGDLEFAREMWPVLQRHLAWEKRCFDGDGDGLYDAYCAIWASDALEYSGGGVTYASAYNYFANTMAAQLAVMLGEDPATYQAEAKRIFTAVNTALWMSPKGWFAEFKDVLGLGDLHSSAGLWTVYHAIDSELPDPFQAYQSLEYVDAEIPHIPVRATGAPGGLFTLSTSNWMPYTWSVNNVALAEVLHTTLAYWQAGRSETAFQLWKSALVESMYLGASPGSFQQLSFYDAFRGELYRDFADPVGMAARSLVEGLFGIRPDALNGTLEIRPGFPDHWEHASLELPDISIQFAHRENSDRYEIAGPLPQQLKLRLRLKARTESIKSIRLNGKPTSWRTLDENIGYPAIEIEADSGFHLNTIEIEWRGAAPEVPEVPGFFSVGSKMNLSVDRAEILDVYDPQQALTITEKSNKSLHAGLSGQKGHRTVFLKLKQGDFQWWAPLSFDLREPVKVLAAAEQTPDGLAFRIQNNTDAPVSVTIRQPEIGVVLHEPVRIEAGGITSKITLNSAGFVCGSNSIDLEWGEGQRATGTVINWSLPQPEHASWEKVPLAEHFNDQVSNIFRHDYASPRVPWPTVQIPLQGVGNWCYPLVDPNIDDTGLRALAGNAGAIRLPGGLPFATPGPGDQHNVVFTSQWDNFPESVTIPLSGKARHLYLLMAGSTNPMQCRFDNGMVEVRYADGSVSELTLRNPETWWPIEQDYYFDGFAFASNHALPPRLHLKTGKVPTDFDGYTNLKGFSNRVIDGGAATVLDLPLNPDKILTSLTIKTLANEVVIGLMGATLLR